MPSNFLNADSSFPWNTAKSNEEKFKSIESYLYMLLEQLRYTLANLESGNFSDSGLNELGNIITKPITLRIKGDEERISELQITAEGLATRVTNAEGDITELSQTADSLASRVTDAEGNISTLQQTASGLSTRVTNAEGNISTLQQTASGLSTRVTNVEGSISTLQQTASGIKAQITDSNGNFTVLNLKSDGLHIGSASGTTTIDGSNITAGTIGADRIKTSELIVGENIAMGPNAVISWNNVNSKPTFATVATSGKYSDLTGRPSIPYVPSYITSTKITSTTIESPTITGGTITGATVQSINENYKVVLDDGALEFYYGTVKYGGITPSDALGNFYIYSSSDTYLNISPSAGLIFNSAVYGPLSERPTTAKKGQIYFATS